jgi:hypothetical protein
MSVDVVSAGKKYTLSQQIELGSYVESRSQSPIGLWITFSSGMKLALISRGVGPAGVGVSARRSRSCSTDRGTLAVRERDLDQHALQVALRLQQLRLTGVFGNVEVAARAGHAVWALLEEAVAAISMAKIEVLPRCT